jgi:hypothetical protein
MSNPKTLLRRKNKKGKYLEALEQPSETFYKDEGGKSSCLKFVVRLQGIPAHEFEDFALKASLYFESGEEVTEDLLTIVGNQYEPIMINEHDGQATICFRVEKVSRRKDNQRFKIFVEPDIKNYPLAKGIAGVFCDPIMVLSKRKGRSAERRASDEGGGSSLKRQKFHCDNAEEAKAMRAQIAVLMDTTSQLVGLVKAQNDRMVMMESSLLKIAAALPSVSTASTTTLAPELQPDQNPVALLSMKRQFSDRSTSSSDSSGSDDSTAEHGGVDSESDVESFQSKTLPGVDLSIFSPPVQARLSKIASSTGSLLGCFDKASLDNLFQGGDVTMDLPVLQFENVDGSTEVPTRPKLRGILSSGFEVNFF